MTSVIKLKILRQKFEEQNSATKKRARTDLLIDQKREIINWVDQHTTKPSDMHIANYFKEKYGVSIGRTTIGDILSNADKYFDNENIRAHGCKRLKNPEQIHLEKALYMWYSEARTHNLQYLI